MSKLMSVLGILLLAVGAAMMLIGLVNPAQVQISGLTLETAAIFIVGGVLAIGQGAILAALPAEKMAESRYAVEPPRASAVPVVPAAPAMPEVSSAPETPSANRIRFTGFGRKPVDAAAAGVGAVAGAAAATVGAAVTQAVEPARSSVQDTIDALEQAKTDLSNAVGGVAQVAESNMEEAAAAVDEDITAEETLDAPIGEEGELYVLEERVIRGRPARILSDNTVEAETDEGWMRFENLEHLNEYLDAAGEQA